MALISNSVPQASNAMLCDWFVARIDVSTHSEFVLCGYVYGHRRLRDGDMTITSTLLELADDESWARTFNTLYRLHETGVPGEYDHDWRLRLVLAADARLRGSVSLLGVRLHVAWPMARSPASKYPKPQVN